jgi:hypothetical protein
MLRATFVTAVCLISTTAALPDGRFQARPDCSEQNSDEPAVAEAASSKKQHAAQDLMGDIDLRRDVVSGAWQRAGKRIVSPHGGPGRLVLPTDVPPEYDLTVTVTRLSGANTLAAGLVVQGHPVLACLDAHEGRLHCGLEMLDGKYVHENESARPGRILETGRPVRLLFSVRRGEIGVSADCRAILSWRGDPSRLSMNPALASPQPDLLSLLTLDGSFAFTQIELTPVLAPGD